MTFPVCGHPPTTSDAAPWARNSHAYEGSTDIGMGSANSAATTPTDGLIDLLDQAATDGEEVDPQLAADRSPDAALQQQGDGDRNAPIDIKYTVWWSLNRSRST